ncbi:MAG: HAD hydrolase-like protein, partial [Candidatus Izemoplasmatales bacterium]
AVVVGDRMYTDIQSGINAKVTTIAVLSGESRLEDIIASPIQPDYVISSIKILAELFYNNRM